MRRGIELNKKQLIECIEKSKGNVGYVCKMMKCCAAAVYNWINKDKEVSDAFEEAREQEEIEIQMENIEILKKAYDSIKFLLDERDTTATIFTLKTLGKNHGWDESKKENVNTTESEKFSSLMEMISSLQSARNILDNSINNEQKSE